MPTLTYVDGFESRVASANDLAGTDGEGLYDSVTGTAISWVAGRTGGYALRLSPAAGIVQLQKLYPGTNPDTFVDSLYYRFPSSLPTGTTLILRRWSLSSGDMAYLLFNDNASGKFQVQATDGDIINIGPTLSADTWYRVDVKITVNGTVCYAFARVDGGTEDGSVGNDTSTSITGSYIGTSAAQTYTLDVDDWVVSATGTDHPLGAHKVLAVVPIDDDTTASNYGTGVMEQGTGSDLSSGNPGSQYLDDWPPINADAENDADHVTQSVVGASNQVVVDFQDTTETTIWGAIALVGLKADATQADSASAKIIYSDASELNIYTGDQSETSAHYRTQMLAKLWVDTQEEFNGLQGVVGRCTNDAGDPEWLALMIQYAVPEGGGTETPQAVAITMSLTLAMPRRPGKLVATTASVTSALARRLNRTLALTASHTVGAAKQMPKTIAASITGAVGATKQIPKAVAATVTGTVDMARQKVKQLAVAVTSALTVGFTRNIGKPLATTLSLGVALAKRVGKVVATSSAVTASLTRRVAKLVAVTVTGTVANSTQKVKQLAIAVTTTVSAALSKLPRKLVAVSPTVAVALIRRVGKPLAMNISHAVGVVADKISGGGELFYQTIAVAVRFIRRRQV